MAESMLKNMRAVRPGGNLREDVLPPLGRPKTEIARLLGLSRQALFNILNKYHPITPAMALRLAKRGGRLKGGLTRSGPTT